MKPLLLSFLLIVFCDLLIAQVPSWVPTSGLVAYYPFNSNANNAFGPGNNGVPHGSVAYAADRFGSANSSYKGNGSSGINFPGHTFPIGNTTRSLSIFFKMPLPYPGGIRVLFGWGNNVTPGRRFGTCTDGTHIGFESVGVGVQLAYTPDSAWHNLTVTYPTSGAGSPSIKTYFDGYLTPTTIFTSLSILNTDTGNIHCAGTLFLSPTWTYSWIGQLDDIGVWNRELTPCEVLKIWLGSSPLPPILGTLNICTGSQTTLSTTGRGGTWSSSSTAVATIGTNGIVTGIAAGTSVISYTFSPGCISTATVSVSPLPGAISGSSSICTGLSATLSNTMAGGSWSSSNPSVATIGSASGFVSGFTSGTTTITYTTGLGCAVTRVLTVNPSPSAITGPTAICTGLTATLSNTVAGGTWSSSNTASAIIGSVSGIVTAALPGTAVITYTLSNGCTATTTLIVNPSPPAISGSTRVCMSNTITLSNIAPGGSWSSINPAIAAIGSGSGIVLGVSGGVVAITYAFGTGCHAIHTVSVNVLVPITGTTTICNGSGSTLYNSGGVWSSGNTTVAAIGSSSGIVSTFSPGTSAITYTMPSGCSTTVTVTVLPALSPIVGSNVCVGSTITLSSASFGGSWSTASSSGITIGSASGIVSGITAGTVAVTYSTGSGGCTITATISVLPLPPPITGTTIVCSAATTTLSSGSGGAWTSSVPTVATVASGSGIVTGLAGGTSVITFTAATGCISMTTITVNPLAAVSGVTAVCTGSTVTLSSPVSGGTWTTTSTSIITVSATGIVSGMSAGTGIVSYLSPAGCIATLPVTVTTAPSAISGPSAICTGGSGTLSNSVSGGIWSSGSTAVGIGSVSGIISGILTGTTTITYSLGASCTTTATLTVNSSPAISVGVPSVCPGSTFTLSTSIAGGTWSVGTTAASVSAAGVVSAMSAGIAIIFYTSPAGCMASVTTTVNALPAAITGRLTLCSGQTTTLSNSTTGGSWTSGSSGIAGIGSASGIATGIAIGTASISYTSGTGCYTVATVTVTSPPPFITGPSSVCAGLTLTLSNSVGGGTWSSSPAATVGSATGIVTGIFSGAAIVTYTLPSACFILKTITVTSSPTAITGTAAICAGGTTTLSNALGGGSWGSSNTAVATLTPSGGGMCAVTGVAAGTSLISYSLGVGCSAVLTITVNPVPPPITGTTYVCPGQTTSLGNALAGGTWSSVSPAVSVSSVTGVVSGIFAGTASVTYSVAGCINTTSVTVYPLPGPITGSLAACIGMTATLSSSSAGGAWSSSNPVIASVAGTGTGAGVVTGALPGTVTITYSLPGTCFTTITQTVSPMPPPVTGATFMCNGSSVTLSNASAGGVWSSGNTSIASINASTGVATGVAPGTVTISYTANGCTVNILILVNRLPAPITGSDTICAWGSTIHLFESDTTGIWNSVLVSTDSTGAVTSYAPGIGSVTYTLPTGCFITKTITVHPLPASISGPVYVCLSGSVTLSDASSGGTWSSPGATGIVSVGTASGIVTGIANGRATITYTIPIGGCITTQTIDVNPLPHPVTGASNVCVAGTVTLSDATHGGVWSSSNTAIASVSAATGVVTGLSSGTANISYTVTNLCGPATTTHTITVNPLPDAGIITGPSEVCEGSTITLSDPVNGGIWNSVKPVIAGVASLTFGSVVTGIVPGLDTITYAATNMCGTATASHPVLVTPLPIPAEITGGDVICVGEQLTVAASIPGGTWSSGSSAVSITASGVVTGVITGIVPVTYTVTNSCGSALAVHTITVNAQPDAGAINGLTTLCAGETIVLSASAAGGTWSGGNLVAIVSDSVVTGIFAGISTVTYSVSNACGTASALLAVTVNPLPDPGTITGIDSICPGDTVTLSATQPDGNWTTGNSLIAEVIPATVGSSSIIGIAAGTGMVTYTVTRLGCTAKVAYPITVRDESSCTEVAEKIKGTGCSFNGQINIYPNPTTNGQITVDLHSAINEVANIIVFDIAGRKVHKGIANTNTPLSLQLNVPQATYIVLAITAHGKCVEKITVQE